MRLLTLAVASLGCAACAHLSPKQAIANAEKLGAAIFEQDQVSAQATDVAMTSGAFVEGRRPIGWVTLPTPTGWQVDFIASQGASEVVAVRITFERQPGGKLRATPAVVENLPLAGEERAMFLARQTALAHPLPRCSDKVNPVVLPAALVGQEGWLVYLLPSTGKRGVVPIGLKRFRVSADGQSVVDAEALTRLCVELDYGNHAAALVISHPLSDTPMEHHVYASLASGVTLTVTTTSNWTLWNVEAGHITKWGEVALHSGD